MKTIREKKDSQSTSCGVKCNPTTAEGLLSKHPALRGFEESTWKCKKMNLHSMSLKTMGKRCSAKEHGY